LAKGNTEIVQSVSIGSRLFQPGDRRHAYRIERGTVVHFNRRPDGSLEVIEFAFPGDVIGLGYLPEHSSSAVAMVDTVVSTMSTETLDQRLAVDDRLSFRLASAGERDFDYLRAKTLAAPILEPVQQLANYLLAITSIDHREGREATLITDEVSSGYVADQLSMSIDTLSMALLSLRRSGIVEVSGKRLSIVDVDKLEAIAEAA
jgi:CRP/FNR family transcriptional regulator